MAAQLLQQQQQDDAKPPQPQVIIFALCPGLAFPGRILDYMHPVQAKVLETAKKKLTDDFDCTPEDLPLFLGELHDRAQEYNWDPILLVPKGGDHANMKHLIESYGELTYADIRQHAETYVHSKTRMAQDSFLLYLCIKNSLTTEGLKKVLFFSHSFPFRLGRDKCVGALLLKVVIMVSQRRNCRLIY